MGSVTRYKRAITPVGSPVEKGLIEIDFVYWENKKSRLYKRRIKISKMNVEVRRYDHLKDYSGLLEIIKSEGEEWKDYLGLKYQKALKQSITYVAYNNQNLCGYSRSMNDNGLYIWIIDLLVDKKFRGNAIGKKLMECMLSEYPGQDVFVMSDVDEYYKKLGYRKEGSIFKVG